MADKVGGQPGVIKQNQTTSKAPTTMVKKSFAVDLEKTFSKVNFNNRTDASQINPNNRTPLPPLASFEEADAQAAAEKIIGSTTPGPNGKGNIIDLTDQGITALASNQASEASLAGVDDHSIEGNFGGNGLSPEENERRYKALVEAQTRIAQFENTDRDADNETRARDLCAIAQKFFNDSGIQPDASSLASFMKLDPESAKDSPLVTLAAVSSAICSQDPNSSGLPRAFMTVSNQLDNQNLATQNALVPAGTAVANTQAAIGGKPVTGGAPADPNAVGGIKF